MQERPEARELLAAARGTLLERLLPALPPALHYEARMIANAMAIAARAAAPPPVPAALAADAACLAAAIRRGAFAPGTPGHAACAGYLRGLAEARARVSNPKALAR